jgi:competence protein ComGC
MKNRRGLTLIETIVIIVIILFLLAIFMPPLGKVKPIAQRVICGTNLKGIGTALSVYADDYDGSYPQLPGNGSWSKELGFDYYLKEPDFKPGGPQYNSTRTITASWYLLVKYADVAPKSFVCPSSLQEEFDGINPNNIDIVELWDFGFEPHKSVSYAIQNPYGNFPAHKKLPAILVIAADMNPWFYNGDPISPGKYGQSPQMIKLTDESTWRLGISRNHQKEGQLAEGHNVLYADGRSTWEIRPDVGINNDNIFTFWSEKTGNDPNESYRRIGQPPRRHTPENDAKDKDDSFLAI